MLRPPRADSLTLQDARRVRTSPGHYPAPAASGLCARARGDTPCLCERLCHVPGKRLPRPRTAACWSPWSNRPVRAPTKTRQPSHNFPPLSGDQRSAPRMVWGWDTRPAPVRAPHPAVRAPEILTLQNACTSSTLRCRPAFCLAGPPARPPVPLIFSPHRTPARAPRYTPPLATTPGGL